MISIFMLHLVLPLYIVIYRIYVRKYLSMLGGMCTIDQKIKITITYIYDFLLPLLFTQIKKPRNEQFDIHNL